MAQHREPFSVDVGSKLLLVSVLLLVFGVLALVLRPALTAMAPTPPPAPEAAAAAAPAGPPAIVSAIFPGLMLIIVSVVAGVLAGIFLGYAENKHPREQ